MQQQTARFGTARGRRAATAALLLTLLVGCNSIPFFQHKIATREMVLDVGEDANDRSAIAVELVAVGDDALLAKLQDLSADQWFATRANWQRDFPDTLQSWSYEIPPGRTLQLKPTPFAGQRAKALLLFAQYKKTGAHRLRLDSYPRVMVHFAEQEMQLEPLP